MTDRIVVIGEALIDLIKHGDGSYQAKPGGAPANVSIALARLGSHVSFAGRMSTDGFGEQLHTWLSVEDIDLSLVERTDDPTTLAVASLDEGGKATYSFYVKGTADWGWTLGAFVNLEVTPPAALVIGSVATAIDPGATVIENLAGHLHSTDSSTVVIDLNIRPGPASIALANASASAGRLRWLTLSKPAMTTSPGYIPNALPMQRLGAGLNADTLSS